MQENGLKKIVMSKVTHTPELVQIEGIKGFGSCEYCSSVHGAEASILRAIGEALSYDELICYSSFAFKTGIHRDLCPSAGHPACGYSCLDSKMGSLPWKLKCFTAFPWGEQRTEEERRAFEADVCNAVRESIDLGIPVHYGSEEDGLIIGYADDGRRWWCIHPYHKSGGEPFWFDESDGFACGGDKWPWNIIVWNEPKKAEDLADNMELTVNALRRAVDMWHCTDKIDDVYFTGDSAYEHWLNWLRGCNSRSDAANKAGMQGNGWCFCVLNHCRNIAAEWLEAKANDFDMYARMQLLLAADNYRFLSDSCLKGLDSTWQITPTSGDFDKWTTEMRGEQIRRLESARTYDRLAITAIENALGKLD